MNSSFGITLLAFCASLSLSAAGPVSPEPRHTARYYREQAGRFLREKAEEEQVAAHYAPNFAGWTKFPNPYDSAKKLAAYYDSKAQAATARAGARAKRAHGGETTEPSAGGL